MKILNISHADGGSGAARAAFTLHKALNQEGIQSQLLVNVKRSRDPTVLGPQSRAGAVLKAARPELGRVLARLITGSKPPGIRSHNLLPSNTLARIQRAEPDVVNLHWICGDVVSVAETGKISRPVVWTLHDMWPFAGEKHYFDEREERLWLEGAALSRGRSAWLDRATLQRKRKAWKSSWHIVAPSRWMAGLARQSLLLRDNPVHTIPNALATDVFRPLPMDVCRQLLGIPDDLTIVLFGSIDGGGDPNKGGDLVVRAWRSLDASIREKMGLLILGGSSGQAFSSLGAPTFSTGFLTDDIALSVAYGAADFVVVPSRIDNLPQIGTEAAACGKPVVAFEIGGLSDIVLNERTGILVGRNDIDGLAAGMTRLVQNPDLRANMGRAARAHALENWSYAVVAAQYKAVYAQLA